MNKKRLRKLDSKLRIFSPWLFLVLAIIFGSISILSLRQNNLQMIELRDAVFTADKENDDVEGALRDLREYVYAHMNTNLSTANGVKPPIQLKYTYDRLVKAQEAKIKAKNSKVYAAAEATCKSQLSYTTNRLPCVDAYLKSHGVKSSTPVSEDLYKFDFVSPTWTPDLAGLSMMVSLVFFILFVLRYGLDRWLKHELHDHM